MKYQINPVTIIPARLAATRLPNKPLADIGGLPMIVHVLNRAKAAKTGPVYVAAAEKKIVDVVKKHGGEAILTDPDLPSGTDRVFAALKKIDPKKKFNVVINLQGDLPTIDSKIIKEILIPFRSKETEIVTLAAKIKNQEEINNPNVVKPVFAIGAKEKFGRALYFSREAVPHSGPYFHHIGIYAFSRTAIEKFTKLKPSNLEKIEKLEQLRALENNMRIDVVAVDTIPLGVDTEKDLNMARALIESN